jgi:hypothetical protein
MKRQSQKKQKKSNARSKKTKENELVNVKIPLDVIFSHIAPYAIHSFEDALNWMQTCKAGLKAANTVNKFWEPFLREVMAKRLAWMQHVGFDDMATLLKRNYVMWPKVFFFGR